MILVLSGGVGAARFLRHLIAVSVADGTPREDITTIVNTGDDTVFHGLHVSPDIDTVTYTVSGAIDAERGWGLGGETWVAMEALKRYASVGATTWFNLGDRDLATHLWRTGRLREGATLSEVTAELASAWHLGISVLPMTNESVSTRVHSEIGELAFQEYFVKHQHSVAVSRVEFVGVDSSKPAPGVLDAIAQADRIVIAPSNPIVSIGPLLAVPGIRDAVRARRDATVAISPIIAGAALKGPADRLLHELGYESSVVGVAGLYRDIAATLVIDTEDRGRAEEVETAGMRPLVTETIMAKPGVGESLVRAVLKG